jgi:plastocyanin
MKTKILAALLGLSALAPAAFADGSITGTVSYAGKGTNGDKVKRTKDAKACGADGPDESILVDSGHLQNAVITISAGTNSAPKTAKLDQKGCTYSPHVQAVPTGTSLTIINSDAVLHNIHGYLGDSTMFNTAMPIKNQQIKKTLDKAGLVKVKCDVHNWMNAYIVVSDTPAAVTGKDGSYKIEGLPAGEYDVKVWHEKAGEDKKHVTVPASGAVTADFALK